MLNMSEDKILKIKSLSNSTGFKYTELSNGIQLKNGKTSYTFYTGSKATFCIDRGNGSIERSAGFNAFINTVSNEALNIPVDFNEAMLIIKNEGYVFYIENNAEVQVDSRSEVYMFMEEQLYKKRISFDVNGVKFFSKDEAIEFIKSI